ncbi:hypothetical protein BBK82_32295 [Lentzea guizhouensis]|uniref:ESX secretion-associated protein EspG n=2 Tax=Lentzea guizhouensis TaxID=1586287 RepID=A0A1B2HZL3_9PSEU|nr:ESX secretion-associated protein EspG [Lentzea guizhouensis]ANZ43189.1 hypothetical protein BBK82_32295 [Lentzea guizhouensis]
MDLLATHAGVRWPFPLRVPSFGRLAGERRELLAEAAQGLQARGLATDDGPVGMADELVTALREYQAAVDLVVVGAETTGAVALVHGHRAVVCRQELSGSTVRATSVAAAELSDELAALVPRVGAAQTMPLTVPPGRGRDELAAFFPAPGQGQAGAVSRGGTRLREVSWLDSAKGRVRVDAGADGWLSVNPMRHHEVVRAIGEVAAVARG